MRFAYMILPSLVLVACGQNGSGDDSKVSVQSDANGGGKLKIDGDGVKLDIDVPSGAKVDIRNGVDIDGVGLYPGSNIDSVNVEASDNDGVKQGQVRFGFTSPAAPAKAADWMAGELAKKGVKVERSGDTLTGKDKKGAAFTVTYGPDGANSRGEVVILSN